MHNEKLKKKFKKATRCIAMHQHPQAWFQPSLYAIQCGNKTKHVSQKCHLHRWWDDNEASII